ncbi:DALR anticodon-binding domain-containing protein [Streptomyces sp. NBC_01808]|uniref:DALR anticodon-binding domain-containing protein n=1 Tax=Streptomyces sp. NBC_01808 TaxID=2975947 RepID=UPI002DD9D18C|nr:DALR anticodon-binding domain-containing protein [Streptomyces sp. NBC_01808]WSA40701.1 DALR anticodon-binding domain-containing protein [Streptomyces sp. NBC_01808]
MDPAELTGTVWRTVRSAAVGELGAPVPARVVVERPRPGGSGDYATNAALQLAHAAGRDPLDVAALLRDRLAVQPGIAAVTVTGPGFLNITLRHEGDPVEDALAAGDLFGHGDFLRGQSIRLVADEHPRALVLADSLRRLLLAAGASPGEQGDLVRVRAVAAPPGPGPGAGELPPDVLRWAFLRAPAQQRPRLAPELLLRREANPLFRIQYAHSRTAALARAAAALRIAVETGTGADGPPAAPPAAPVRHTRSDGALRAAIGELPAVVETAARRRAPDRLARHLDVLAGAFLGAEAAHPALPSGDEEPTAVHRARLRRAAAAGVALRSGLTLLGIRAPQHL